MLKRKYNEKNVIDAINYIDSLKNLDVNFKRELLEHLHNIKKTKKITQLVYNEVIQSTNIIEFETLKEKTYKIMKSINKNASSLKQSELIHLRKNIILSEIDDEYKERGKKLINSIIYD